jgi:hypothetical protein
VTGYPRRLWDHSVKPLAISPVREPGSHSGLVKTRVTGPFFLGIVKYHAPTIAAITIMMTITAAWSFVMADLLVRVERNLLSISHLSRIFLR